LVFRLFAVEKVAGEPLDEGAVCAERMAGVPVHVPRCLLATRRTISVFAADVFEGSVELFGFCWWASEVVLADDEKQRRSTCVGVREG
jgi:hypothetical protein